MTKIKITQVKSGIDRPERQKLTLRALGLNKLNASREVEASAQILGMVRKVNHLIRIEALENGEVPDATSDQEVITQAPTPVIPDEVSPDSGAEQTTPTPVADDEEPAASI